MSTFKKQIFSFLILTFIFSSFFFNPLVQDAKADADKNLWEKVKVGGLGKVGEVYGTSGEPEDVRVITARIVKIFLGLLGIIFLVLLILAGFKWMNSRGNEEEVKKAKDQLTVAVIGLLIILAAYSITNFVLKSIYKAAIDNTFE